MSEYLPKSFSTINPDIQRFYNWLIENNCYHVYIESTVKYWILIFNYPKNNIDICLTHLKYIKGKKTDKKDSKWIADLYKFDLVRCSLSIQKIFDSPENYRIPYSCQWNIIFHNNFICICIFYYFFKFIYNKTM